MDDLFLLLFIVSFASLIVGLIRPTAFSRFTKTKTTRTNVGLFFGVLTLMFFILFGATVDSSSEKVSPKVVDANKPTPVSIEEIQKVEPYSIKDVKANEKNFSASVYMPEVTKDLIIKAVKDIKDSNYVSTMNSFEIFIFNDEEIAKKYLKVTDEESVAYDHEMKGWYVRIDDDETLEVLSEFQDVSKLNL